MRPPKTFTDSCQQKGCRYHGEPFPPMKLVRLGDHSWRGYYFCDECGTHWKCSFTPFKTREVVDIDTVLSDLVSLNYNPDEPPFTERAAQ